MDQAAAASPEAIALDRKAWKLAQAEKVEEALATCRELNSRYPGFATGWLTSCKMALHVKRPDVALAAVNKALDLKPEDAEALCQKALCLAHLLQNRELHQLLDRLSERIDFNARQCGIMGLLLTQAERRENAIEWYVRAASLEPGNSQHHYNIAVIQRTLGRMSQAERCLDRAIELNPADYEAWKVRSDLRKQTNDSNHVRSLEKLLRRGISDPRGKTQVCFALAKELEDLGEWEKSFRYLKIGADTRRSYMRYQPGSDLETMAEIENTFVAETFDGSIEGHDSEEPVFILGLPRTGSTLLERILGSHSDVLAAGELTDFTARMMEQARALAPHPRLSKPELVRLTRKLDFRKLGEDYISGTRPLTGATPRFTDKLPINYLYTGLIHLALPKARILNLKRHPLDTCYAIYKQLFADGYPFSYHLEELGRYYLAYHRLMEHWNKVLPGVILTVNYEDLVHDLEGQVRWVLDHCGLEWQPRCLEFWKSDMASATASASQVRQPVYRSSVGKWKHFEEQLLPLIEILEDGGLDLGRA